MKIGKRSFYFSAFVILVVVLLVLEPHLPKAVYYNFPNIDDYKIFPNRVVEKGESDPWELSSKYNQFEIDPDDLSEMKALETTAFLVIKSQKIIYESYWHDFDQNTISNSFSMAKSIVSFLIGAAIADGKIEGINQPVGDFVASYAEGENAQLKIIDLLTMSSGLNWNESYINPLSVTTEAYYGNDIIELISDLQVVETPGERFNYLSGNTQLLALIIHKATGRTLSEYAAEKLWQPLGATKEALWSLDQPQGFEKAYCCFNASARNFARLGQMMLDSGQWKGKTIIPKEYMMQAMSPAIYLRDEDQKQVDFYGYQVWIAYHEGYIAPYARGILGQYIFTIPELNAVVVRLGRERVLEKRDHHPLDVFLYLKVAIDLIL